MYGFLYCMYTPTIVINCIYIYIIYTLYIYIKHPSSWSKYNITRPQLLGVDWDEAPSPHRQVQHQDAQHGIGIGGMALQFQPSAPNISFLGFSLMNEVGHQNMPNSHTSSCQDFFSKNSPKSHATSLGEIPKPPVLYDSPNQIAVLLQLLPLTFHDLSMHAYTSISAQQTEDNWVKIATIPWHLQNTHGSSWFCTFILPARH